MQPRAGADREGAGEALSSQVDPPPVLPREKVGGRPVWMTALMAFCAGMAFAYIPWDFLVKPVEQDEEIWLGIALRGWPAKVTEPLHWLIYALGSYGFWRMKAWMHPWAALYVMQIGVGSLVWFSRDARSPGAWMGWLALLLCGLLAAALWRNRACFCER